MENKTTTSTLPPPPLPSGSSTTPSSTGAGGTSAAGGGEVTLDEGHRLPDIKTLQNAAKLSIVEDKPIIFDYWVQSIEKSVMIGIRDDGKKMLIKSTEEYTSYIEKVYRIAGKDYIIMTEN